MMESNWVPRATILVSIQARLYLWCLMSPHQYKKASDGFPYVNIDNVLCTSRQDQLLGERFQFHLYVGMSFNTRILRPVTHDFFSYPGKGNTIRSTNVTASLLYTAIFSTAEKIKTSFEKSHFSQFLVWVMTHEFQQIQTMMLPLLVKDVQKNINRNCLFLLSHCHEFVKQQKT